MDNKIDFEEDISIKIKRQTIKKVFEQRKEFIIIGLTGPDGKEICKMKDILAKDFNGITAKLSTRDFFDNNVISKLEHKNVYNYAEKNWKKFDVIKARDIIITYILENKDSFNYFIECMQKANKQNGNMGDSDSKYTNFLNDSVSYMWIKNGLLTKIQTLKNDRSITDDDVQGSVEEYKKRVESLIKDFLDECEENNSLLKTVVKLNNDLMEFISSLRVKEIRGKKSDDMSLYVYTKYILPVIGEYIRENMGDEYIRIFQRYGNEIRFFGTLDRTKWKLRLDCVKDGGKFDYFYSIVKRINTFIKIRRAPIFNKESVPIRIVIDSLKNPYEFSFLKDRYSAYYTFAILDDNQDIYDDERYKKENYEKLYEHPDQIKRGFKKFVDILIEAEETNTNGIQKKQSVAKYIKSLKTSSDYIEYIYDKLAIYETNNDNIWQTTELYPSLENVEYGDNFNKNGILLNEFEFYKSILEDPIRVYCMLSNLFPIYLQDSQSAIQNADVLFSQNNSNDSQMDLYYNIVKYVSLIMHPGLVPPTNIERCMQVAFNVKVNSGCISRQVGAVVTDKDYNILSLGWNDVHSNSKVPCIYRSIDGLKQETNIKMKYGAEIEEYSDFELNDKRNFNKEINKYIMNDCAKEILCGLPSCYCFKSVYNKIEHKNNPSHSRSIHGEAKAFLDCDKDKAKGGYLFTTSSSCENCTMIANDYGIKKIYYIEKYPGIAMEHVNATGKTEDRAEFILFSGAIGKTYIKLYAPVIPLKDELELRGIDELYID